MASRVRWDSNKQAIVDKQTDAPYVQATDPGCTAVTDLGKQWVDTTDPNATVLKVCMNRSGYGWSTVTFD